MKCIYCGHDKSKVIDTRDTCDQVRRRRECKDCGRRFTTYETAESLDIKVEKRGEENEKFDEEKIRTGVENAATNTALDEDEIEEIVEEVKEGVLGQEVVKAEEIGDLVLEALKKRNEVAYIRFASVYESFEDAESFQKEVEQLKASEK
ncbi:MAG: transcriptional regulator NrdR [Candidatus Nanosalina sp.]